MSRTNFEFGPTQINKRVLSYEGPLRTKYRMCIYQCYAAYMNAMCNISTSKHVRYKLKVSDKTKRCFIKDEEAETISQNMK